MGDLFNEKYYQLAVNSYQFLLREYPGNRYREDAMLAIGKIEQNDLHDPSWRKRAMRDFWRSTRARPMRRKCAPSSPDCADRAPRQSLLPGFPWQKTHRP